MQRSVRIHVKAETSHFGAYDGSGHTTAPSAQQELDLVLAGWLTESAVPVGVHDDWIVLGSKRDKVAAFEHVPFPVHHTKVSAVHNLVVDEKCRSAKILILVGVPVRQYTSVDCGCVSATSQGRGSQGLASE